MTLKQQFIAVYKKVFQTEEEPDALDISYLASVLSQSLDHPDAKAELGKEMYDIIKKCTKRRGRQIEVDFTGLLDSIRWSEDMDIL